MTLRKIELSPNFPDVQNAQCWNVASNIMKGLAIYAIGSIGIIISTRYYQFQEFFFACNFGNSKSFNS